jgi:hypothetical protein
MANKISNGLYRLDVKDTFNRVVDDLNAARMGILYNTATLDVASLADAAGATSTISVPGAELGDFAFASLGVSIAGMLLTAYVSAPDVVSVRVQNESGGALDLASTTLRVFVVRRPHVRHVFGSDALFGSATVDVASLLDAAGATSSGITVTGAALGDFAFVSHGVDLAGITATAYVQAANTVEVRFQNESGGTVDLASTTCRIMVVPAASVSKAFAGMVKSGATTFDPGSLADGAGETKTVTVAGASLGDFAFASFSLDLQDINHVAWVSAADTVSVRLQNESTGTVDLASGTLRVGVIPRGFLDKGVVSLQK